VTTIAQVARQAGVGVGTVSRVLNRSPRVSHPTRERVLAVIDELVQKRIVAGLTAGAVKG
jgi:DNA-binding LacI/PurR family transcriptional regulator